MCCVLVGFYRKVFRQRSLKAQQTIMINSSSSNDKHGLENQTSSLTNPNSSAKTKISLTYKFKRFSWNVLYWGTFGNRTQSKTSL